MAMIKKDGNFMGLPMNIARGNPIPLDKSEIWYSYEEMINYAQTSPVAYVGQILGLVNEVDNTATAYIILNTDGEVKEVGKATVVDKATIVINEETLSLKDFGKRFYKYMPATENKAASYTLVEVDAENPWRAGLEPKVVSENGQFVLGWYEPNPTTIEGVNAQIAGIQNTVVDLTNTTNTLTQRVNNTYTKEETNAQIAASAHLKREIVEELPAAENAKENVIYMVPNGLTDNDNKYYEYIFINGVFEPVGTWEVDLKDYATKEEVNSTITSINNSLNTINQKIANVESDAEHNYINSVSNSFNVDDNRQLTLISVPTTIDLSSNVSLLNTFIKKDKDKDLVLKTEIEKLLTVKENAEQNIINSVDENEFSVTNDIERKLSIKAIEGRKITNLKDNSEFAEVVTDIQTINDNLESVETEVSTVKSQLATINTSLTTMNTTVTNLTNRLSDVEEAITWQEL